jgi:phosphoribosylanthranilate isomerase
VTYVKICGCRTVEEALAARDAGADFVGMVFAESPRRVTAATARRIVEALGSADLAVRENTCVDCTALLEGLLAMKRPLLVGVFEGQSSAKVRSIAERTGIDVLQLHGGACFDPLAMRWPVIVAVDALPEEDPALLRRAMCLLDGSRGRGRRGDWNSLATVAATRPVILAGGLTPENVAEAVRRVLPWGVDVSSGVETHGRKDAAKMRAFVDAAKSGYTLCQFAVPT